MRGRFTYTTMLVASMIVLMACEPRPQPIQFGSDQCEYCRMMITEPEFGSQIVTNQGRSFKFDSIECMTAYDLTTDNPENIHSKWVPDFLNREHWLEAESAIYLHSESLRSPMGLHLSAYSDQASGGQMSEEYGGEIILYDRVKAMVEQEWLHNNDSSQLINH